MDHVEHRGCHCFPFSIFHYLPFLPTGCHAKRPVKRYVPLTQLTNPFSTVLFLHRTRHSFTVHRTLSIFSLEEREKGLCYGGWGATRSGSKKKDTALVVLGPGSNGEQPSSPNPTLVLSPQQISTRCAWSPPSNYPCNNTNTPQFRIQGTREPGNQGTEIPD